MSNKQISKITAKILLGDLLSRRPDGYREVVAQIHGRVDKVTCKPSSLNPDNVDVKLQGEFVAKNTITGECYQSATLYPFGAGMSDALAMAQPGSMFAFSIILTSSVRAPLGYGFDFESAMQIEPSEAVSRMGDVFKQLTDKSKPVPKTK